MACEGGTPQGVFARELSECCLRFAADAIALGPCSASQSSTASLRLSQLLFG